MSYKFISTTIAIVFAALSAHAQNKSFFEEGQSFTYSKNHKSAYCGDYKFSHLECTCELNGQNIVTASLLPDAAAMYISNIEAHKFTFISGSHGAAKTSCLRKVMDMVPPANLSKVYGKVDCIEKTVKSSAVGFLPIAELFKKLKMNVDSCAPDQITGSINGLPFAIHPVGGSKDKNGIKFTVTPNNGQTYQFKRSDGDVIVSRVGGVEGEMGRFSIHVLRNVRPATAIKRYGVDFQLSALRNLRDVEKYIESPQFQTLCSRQAYLKKLQSTKVAKQ